MLKNSIASINKRLQEILKDDLFRINEEYKRENNKLQDIDKDEALCPYCRQSMKDSEAKENLKKFYRKELSTLFKYFLIFSFCASITNIFSLFATFKIDTKRN